MDLDNHVIVQDLDPTAALESSADELLEDYLASLSTLPMDNSRPLWDVHVLDFPTSEAAASLAFRIHHAIGDGMALISLLIACSQRTSDLKPMISPSFPLTRRKRPIGSLPPRATRLAGAPIVWHSLVDITRFLAMSLLPSSPRTVFTCVSRIQTKTICQP
ncbi:hypothetical protein PR202_gb29276 [Eleusine coracana subsp. coracana]|uniref:diacylglycerol O-acyltransferase n=1 Tax=Eleusine coracana subsp. coracana TaxID=191504 RepID=A0AAV5FZV7_ELECO|nr:hypothetical protein PR202_gb29276 [Eleusine coracana subsp. coracana]